MGKGERLRKTSQFSAVHAQGKTWANNIIVLKALPNGLDCNRYGFVAGKRVGNAVARNRAKRLMRESVRFIPMKHGWDIVFIARMGAVKSGYQQVDIAVHELLARAGVLNRQDGIGKTEKVAE